MYTLILRSLLYILSGLIITNCGQDSISKKSGGDETTNGIIATLVDSIGKPISNARISIHPNQFLFSPSTTASLNETSHKVLYTNSEGIILLDTLPEGEYRFVASKDSTSFSWIQSAPRSHFKDTIALGVSTTIQGKTSIPSGSNTFYVTLKGTDIWSMVSPDGSFEIIGVPIGEWQLSSIIFQKGIVFATDSITIEQEGDTIEIEELTPLPASEMVWQDSASVTVDTRSLGLVDTLYQFPLFLDLSDSLFPVGISENATDLRLEDASGQDIPFEIALWTPLEHRLRITFLAPIVPASDSLIIAKIKWNNPAALTLPQGQGVFDTAQDWAGAWHLIQWKLDSAGILRAPSSTPGIDDGVIHGTLSATSQGIWFDGSNQSIALPPLDLDLALQDWTIDFWIRPEAEGISILNRSLGLNAWNHRQKSIYLGKPGLSAGDPTGMYPAIVGANTINAYSFADTGLTLNDYQHVSIRRRMITPDSGTIDWFINGVATPSAYPDSLTTWDSDGVTDSLYIGGVILDRGMQGWMRELGISRIARSDDWIRLRYFSTKILASNWIVTLHHP